MPASTNPLTHAKLGKRFNAMGHALGKGAIQKAVNVKIAAPAGHKNGFFKRTAAAAKSGGMAHTFRTKPFGQRYREVLDAHDELVSTSSVRELYMGVLASHGAAPMPADRLERLNEVFDMVSQVRLPTKLSGFARGPGLAARRPHPTESGAGGFAAWQDPVSAHYALDLRRRAAVIEAAEQAKASGAPVEHIATAMVRRAISFTLNEFTAPMTASDIHPFLKSGTPAALSLHQVQLRERLKAVFVQFGGGQTPAPPAEHTYGRAWGNRKDLRDVSPPRMKH
jgi:hypothetical protein